MSDGSRRFPPPWRADKMPGGYVVRDASGQAIAYLYSRPNESEAMQAKVLTADEARRIAPSRQPPASYVPGRSRSPPRRARLRGLSGRQYTALLLGIRIIGSNDHVCSRAALSNSAGPRTGVPVDHPARPVARCGPEHPGDRPDREAISDRCPDRRGDDRGGRGGGGRGILRTLTARRACDVGGPERCTGTRHPAAASAQVLQQDGRLHPRGAAVQGIVGILRVAVMAI